MDNNSYNTDDKKDVRIKLKSEMYNNHNVENIDRREEKHSDAMLWGFALGFLLFIIILIMMIIFVR